MSLVPYQSNNNKLRKRKNKNMSQSLISAGVNQLVNNPQGTLDLANWSAKQLASAVRGIASAFRTRGMGKQEMSRIVAPLATSIKASSSKPKFSSVEGGIRIMHTEAIVATETTLRQVVTSETFAWLANIARGYEEWRIKAEYAYVPICPATTTGSVMMAFDYDPSDDNDYANYTDYFNTADHCIAACWAPAAISPTVSGWLKTGASGADPRLYSPGIFHAKTNSIFDGYLLVRYAVELRKAQPIGDTYAIYNGNYSTIADPLAGLTYTVGDGQLIKPINGHSIQVLSSSRVLTIWSTDGENVTVPTGGIVVGTVTNDTRTCVTWYTEGPQTLGLTLTGSVGGGTTYTLRSFVVDAKPIYL